MTQAEADHAIADARAAGIDVNLVELNLALTPEERVLRHQSALELMLAFREAGAALRRETAAPSAPTAR
ncbi:MAG: hypothetical protein WCL04_04120 [Verrucomicrobiota bacterium]